MMSIRYFITANDLIAQVRVSLPTMRGKRCNDCVNFNVRAARIGKVLLLNSLVRAGPVQFVHILKPNAD